MAKRFGFTYLVCNDLHAMKSFYSEILRLEQIWEDATALAYRIGDHQLSVLLDERVVRPEPDFAVQPGWSGGTAPRTSWSLECDAPDFVQIVAAAKAAGVATYRSEPSWVGYWSFPLLDPMHNTLEVTCTVAELV